MFIRRVTFTPWRAPRLRSREDRRPAAGRGPPPLAAVSRVVRRRSARIHQRRVAVDAPPSGRPLTRVKAVPRSLPRRNERSAPPLEFRFTAVCAIGSARFDRERRRRRGAPASWNAPHRTGQAARGRTSGKIGRFTVEGRRTQRREVAS